MAFLFDHWRFGSTSDFRKRQSQFSKVAHADARYGLVETGMSLAHSAIAVLPQYCLVKLEYF